MAEDRSVIERGGRAPDEVLRYGSADEQRIDVLRPGAGETGSDGPGRPLVILLHGGYWRPQWDRAHMQALADALSDEGCIVANVEYRRIPGDPDAMTADVLAALGLLAHDVAAGREIVVVGFSAGGHLALWLAGQATAAPIARVIALAPVADLTTAEELDLDEGGVRDFLGTSAADRPDIDPLQATPAVPVHLVHDPADEFVPIALSEQYAQAHADADVTLHRATGGHFALIDPEHEGWPAVRSRILGIGDAGTMLP